MLRFELDGEFYKRVKHNFRTYALLTSIRVNWSENEILESIYRLNGYKCHKTVKYGRNTSHIHVRFEEDYLASEAVEFLNQMNTDLKAVLVDDMLRDWFNYEMKMGYSPPCTVTIVDIVGCPPHGINLLTSYVLGSIFQDFGAPYLLPYTAAFAEQHVQVVFNSMAEALAACIAFGEWHSIKTKLDNFSYRVRINPSNREGKLIRNSGGTPDEAFELDYFLNMRSDTRISKGRESLMKQNTSRSDVSLLSNQFLRRVRKQKFAAPEQQMHLSNQLGYQTRILCVPVIAPITAYNENPYGESWMASNQFNADFSTSLDYQQPNSISTPMVVTTNNYERNSTSQFQHFEGNFHSNDKDLNRASQSLEKPSSDSTLPQKEASLPRKIHYSSAKPKKFSHKGTRVFERRQ